MNGSKSDWIAVSGGTDLAPSSARAVSAGGLDIVVWRSAGGTVQAWENRCPHRGMRLSFGQVRGDNLVCRYHGWSFDQTGQCRHIPASPEMTPPPTACVETYACREALGLIWVNTTDDHTASLIQMAEQTGLADEPYFVKSIYVGKPLTALAAFFDDDILMPGIVRLSTETTREDILLALQQSAAERCALHIVVRSKSDTARELYYIDWARRLRWHLSNPETPTTRQEITA